MRLDDETLALLGWGALESREDGLHLVRTLKPSRIAAGDVDGRSKRNWRHKRQTRATTPIASPLQEQP